MLSLIFTLDKRQKCVIIVLHADKQNSLKGIVRFKGHRYMNFNDVKDYVKIPNGKHLGDFICSDDCFVRIIGVENKDEFISFIEDITKDDLLKLYFENEADGNIFYTFTAPFGMLHTYYTAYSSTVRLVFDSLSQSIIPPIEDGEYNKITDPALTVMSLDYKRMVPGAAYGMSYVFTLSDGSYLIYDGGLRGDADHLIDFMRDNNKRKDGKISVAAWIITHAHDDHYECLKTILEKFSDKLDIEKFVFNDAREEYFTSKSAFDGFLTTKIYELAADKFPSLKYVRLHTGQKLAVRDCVIETIFTHEDIYPSLIEGMNAASLITKVHLAGQTFMFLADDEGQSDEILPKMYSKALKSDFVQVAHHGYSGGSDKLYDLISPEYAMWPTAAYFFNLVKEGKWEKAHSVYLLDSIKVKEAFIAEGGHKTLMLPYNS